MMNIWYESGTHLTKIRTVVHKQEYKDVAKFNT